MQPIISTKQEDDQALLAIQQEVGLALRRSFDSVTSERLPESMILLLLRLALAQSVCVRVRPDGESDRKKGHRPDG